MSPDDGSSVPIIVLSLDHFVVFVFSRRYALLLSLLVEVSRAITDLLVIVFLPCAD